MKLSALKRSICRYVFRNGYPDYIRLPAMDYDDLQWSRQPRINDTRRPTSTNLHVTLAGASVEGQIVPALWFCAVSLIRDTEVTKYVIVAHTDQHQKRERLLSYRAAKQKAEIET